MDLQNVVARPEKEISLSDDQIRRLASLATKQKNRKTSCL